MVNYTLIINKNSEINIKTFKNIDLLYKTCLFRKSDNFKSFSQLIYLTQLDLSYDFGFK